MRGVSNSNQIEGEVWKLSKDQVWIEMVGDQKVVKVADSLASSLKKRRYVTHS